MFTSIAIPRMTEQQNSQKLNNNIVIGPEPDLYSYPMTFYRWDFNTNTIDEFNVLDDDAYDDLIEIGNDLVITLGYEFDYDNEATFTGGCEGGFVVGDNNCDGNCGENATNSPNDCGNHDFNKVVYLQEFGINTDVKDKKATGWVPWIQHA